MTPPTSRPAPKRYTIHNVNTGHTKDITPEEWEDSGDTLKAEGWQIVATHAASPKP